MSSSASNDSSLPNETRACQPIAVCLMKARRVRTALRRCPRGCLPAAAPRPSPPCGTPPLATAPARRSRLRSQLTSVACPPARPLSLRTHVHAGLQADQQRALVRRAHAGVGKLSQVERDCADFVRAAPALVNLQKREQQRLGLETRVGAPVAALRLRGPQRARARQQAARRAKAFVRGFFSKRETRAATRCEAPTARDGAPGTARAL